MAQSLVGQLEILHLESLRFYQEHELSKSLGKLDELAPHFRVKG